MCRWLAYIGEPLRPSTIVLDAKHSIVAQSLDSPLGAETVNGDGFGFGWYPTDAAAGTAPAFFHSIEPAWNDVNLREITRAIESPLFFTHVRAATTPPVQQTNCHPFRHDNWMFMHNGAIAGWRELRRDLTLAIDPSLYPTVLGTTDSEVVFHLALTLGLRDDPLGALGRDIRMVESVGEAKNVRFPWQGTVAVSDGTSLWAVRYSTQGRTRSLFHSVDIPTLRQMYPDQERLATFGDTAKVVVSEPLNDLPGAFLEVPESSALTIDPDGYRHQPFLAA
ncbi:class II glutamine amidotransferase [Cryobacterium sp. 1639]|uniref:class II glutamine amidotransferase n=1 Tax=Cryobacterium inferilacus TaxID=2866629 RepID=UPI001C72F618|nr:class II glutamine amidotransferase [Cryobacterium sp. 1639]MBX0299604.1 class II glutamine amidotransferase [Cryobacterium sp. 1639]